MVQVVLINQSTVVSNAEVEAALPDFQKQVSQDFAPIWGRDAQLSTRLTQPYGAWPLYILDSSDVEGALGYHDVDSQGMPYGKVFAQTAKADNVLWTTTLSHELLEMLVDPFTITTVFIANDSSGTAGTIYIVEDSDAVEGRSYKSGNTMVSDFVLPSYYNPNDKTGVYDFMKVLKAPLTIDTAGYISFNSVTGSGWQQRFGEKARKSAS